MNNVQFITWKPIYWIQHLALSPLHLFFNTSAKKKKRRKKERRQADSNSQSHFWIVFSRQNPCCSYSFVQKSCHYNDNLCMFAAQNSRLFLFAMWYTVLLRLGNKNTDSYTPLYLLWDPYKGNKCCWQVHNTCTGEQRWILVSVAPSCPKDAAIVMLNISSIDWGLQKVQREYHREHLSNLCALWKFRIPHLFWPQNIFVAQNVTTKT